MRHRRLELSTLAALAAALFGGCGSAAAPPNVLLITVDTLRPDHLGAYGYPHATSPAIDRLFAEGTGFPTALVPRGQTWPSLASILTSLYPVTHGVRRNGLPLADDATTLASVLAEHGYATAALLANSGKAHWPGFDEMLDLRRADGRINRAAIDWLERNSERRFFLWVHYFAPHRPYDPPPLLRERFDSGYTGEIDGSIEQIDRIAAERIELAPRDLRHLVARYDAEIRRLDRLVGRLLSALAAADLDARTLLVFTSDHGEELYERNSYVSHSASVYDSVLRAPLLFRRPGAIPAGRWSEGVAEAVDLAPTVLELCGLPVPRGFVGASLAGRILGIHREEEDRAAFSELEDRVVTIRTQDWRLVHNPSDFDFPLRGTEGAFYPIDRVELYSHASDPAERQNLAGARPEVVDSLRERVLAWQRRHGWEQRNRDYEGQRVPEDVRERLEALGYAE